jgi:Omp85 superfamily domain
MRSHLFRYTALAALLASPHLFAADDDTDRSGLITRTVRHYFSDDETSDGGGLHWGPLRPRIEVVSSGGGLAPMLHFWAPDIGDSRFDVHASAAYSMYRYQYYDLQLGWVPHEGNRTPRVQRSTNSIFFLGDLDKTAGIPGFNLYFDGRYRDYPREDFYGIGPSTLESGRADYRLKEWQYEGVVRFQLGHLSLMGRGGMLHTSIGPGLDSSFDDVDDVYTDFSAPGLTPTLDLLHLGGGAWLDFRDQRDNPHRGASLGVLYSRFDDRHDRFSFDRYVADAREYVPLGTDRLVLALHEVGAADRPDSGNQVPFYLEHTLGGSRFLRGYKPFRFRDEKLMALSGELRVEVHPKVELAFFYDAGKVFPRMADFDFDHLQTSYGAGIRLKSSKKVRVRVDVGHSREGTEVHVKLGPAF